MRDSLRLVDTLDEAMSQVRAFASVWRVIAQPESM